MSTVWGRKFEFRGLALLTRSSSQDIQRSKCEGQLSAYIHTIQIQIQIHLLFSFTKKILNFFVIIVWIYLNE